MSVFLLDPTFWREIFISASYKNKTRAKYIDYFLMKNIILFMERTCITINKFYKAETKRNKP